MLYRVCNIFSLQTLCRCASVLIPHLVMFPPSTRYPTSSVRSTVDNAASGSPRSSDALVSRRINDYLDTVEDAVQEVYRFAQGKARCLSNTVGRHPDYYMSMIFQRCAFLHPTLKRRTVHYFSGCMEGSGKLLDL